jgi:thiol-disulfide isomerase/thioredoxin
MNPRMALPSVDNMGSSSPRRVRPGTLVAPLAACVLSLLSAGGCTEGPSKIATLPNYAAFQRYVLMADRPVLLDIYKTNCPTCVIQDVELNKLADEYSGRVLFYKFRLMDADFTVLCPQLREKYDLQWVPTTILFVNGREKQRWVFNHGADEFRPVLKEACRASYGATPLPTTAGPRPPTATGGPIIRPVPRASVAAGDCP